MNTFNTTTKQLMFIVGFLILTYTASATVFTVDNAANTDDFLPASAGTMTFVKCIRLASADATGGATGHRIYFNISPAGQKILTVGSNWQQLTNTNLNNLIIDGTTQTFAGSGPHIIFVSGGITEGISIAGLTNVTLTGLGFRNFQIAIKMDNAISCKITNCYIGTDNTGTTPSCTGCTDAGIRLNNGCQSNVIGGSTTGTRNIIYGHLNGVYLTGATTSNNTIGATASGEANVISANTQDGVYIFNAGTGNKVAGNIIGLDVTGTVASATYSNLYKGIHAQGTQSVQIGGSTSGERNIVSGNGYGTGNDGIFLESSCHNSTITNCYIGLDITGVSPLANKIRGILILTSNNCQVTSNVIAAQSEFGIYIQNSAGTTIKSNIIGMNVAGNGNAATLGNQIGINVENSTGTIIGGTTAADCNYISGNREHGIRLDGSTTSQIMGNKIGITPSGAALGNQAYGIYLRDADNNTIGGATTAYANEIANNTNSGIGLSSAYWSGDGSTTASGSDNNFIYRNKIHHNSEDGIRLYKVSASASVMNWMSENLIYCNSGIGINLTLSNGNNNNKPAPVLTGVVVATNTVSGTASANDYIEVFIDNACPTCQGRTFLGSTSANGAGAWTFSNAAITSTNNLTATATDASGTNRNTSQFATCISTLPLQFVSFEGRLTDQGVLLTWVVSQEQNNNYFEIQRSDNGTDYSTVGIINGINNTSSLTEYSFKDESLADQEKYYYRIVQVDNDGKSSTSKILCIRVTNQKESTVYLYPNPCKEKVTFECEADPGIVILKIKDVEGKEITSVSYTQDGYYFKQTLRIADLLPGMYFFDMTTTRYNYKGKFMVE